MCSSWVLSGNRNIGPEQVIAILLGKVTSVALLHWRYGCHLLLCDHSRRGKYLSIAFNRDNTKCRMVNFKPARWIQLRSSIHLNGEMITTIARAMTNVRRFKFEGRHAPHISFQTDRDLRERGSRPLIFIREARLDMLSR